MGSFRLQGYGAREAPEVHVPDQIFPHCGGGG